MNADFTPSTSKIADLIRSRRTINDFRAEAPPVEVILQAIEVARWAPNHKLTEPWRFHLLGPETVRRLIELNTRLLLEQKGLDAARKKQERWSRIPGWLVVSCLRSEEEIRNQENYAAVCCAIQNLALFLWSENIGVKWSTGPVSRHHQLYSELQIDIDAEQIVGMIWYGYPENVANMRRRDVGEIAVFHP